MAKKKIKTKEDKKGGAIQWLITASLVLVSLIGKLREKGKQMRIEKRKEGIYMILPKGWFSATKVEVKAVGLGQKATTKYQSETWQGALLLRALKLIGVGEQNMRFHMDNGSVCIHLVNLPKEVRIHTNIQQLLECRRFLNNNWNMRKQNYKKGESAKEYSTYRARTLAKMKRLWNSYAGNQLLHLLMGNIEYSEDVKSTDKVFFVKKTTYRNKYSDEERLNNANEWEVIGASEIKDLEQNVFAAPVVSKHRIRVVDSNGRVENSAKRAKELLGMSEKRVDWDDINAEAVKQGRFIKSYPQIHEILAPIPSVISDLACATVVNERDSVCNIRNNLNLKTILGSKSGQYYEKDTEEINEDDLDHLRHIVSRFGVYTGSVNLIFVNDESEIPTSGFDGTKYDGDNPSDDEKLWVEAFSKDTCLDWQEPEDPSQRASWNNFCSNTVNNPIFNKWVKHTGAMLRVGSLEVNKDLETIPFFELQGIDE